MGVVDGEHHILSVANRTELDLHRWPSCPSLRGVSTGADRSWVLEHGVYRIGPGRGLPLAAKETV